MKRILSTAFVILVMVLIIPAAIFTVEAAGNNYIDEEELEDSMISQSSDNMHTCNYLSSTEDATCTTPEFEVRRCSECGNCTKTVSSSVLGHAWSDWSNKDGVSTRSCSVCGVSESKTVSALDTSKILLALGDSITYGFQLDDTTEGSWAKQVFDYFKMSEYVNRALTGSEVYQWYSVLTGRAAPNGKKYLDINGFDRIQMTEDIKRASVIVFSLGTNDMTGGYVDYRTAQQVHDILVAFVDEIHAINPNAIVVSVGFAYSPSVVSGGIYEASYQHFVDFNNLMTNTLNSGDYNEYAYYIDASDVFSDKTNMADGIHPNSTGHKKIADSVIAALASAEMSKADDPLTSAPDDTNENNNSTDAEQDNENKFDFVLPVVLGVVFCLALACFFVLKKVKT